MSISKCISDFYWTFGHTKKSQPKKQHENRAKTKISIGIAANEKNIQRNQTKNQEESRRNQNFNLQCHNIKSARD